MKQSRKLKLAAVESEVNRVKSFRLTFQMSRVFQSISFMLFCALFFPLKSQRLVRVRPFVRPFAGLRQKFSSYLVATERTIKFGR